MKFDRQERETSANVVREKNSTPMGRMEASSEKPADMLQAELYNSGSRLLKTLDTVDGAANTAGQTYRELLKQLAQLRDFHFNIGFAGGMSSGKSTVINSMIEYPLMPTCKLTTTCVGTHMFYGERPRISVTDDDSGNQVLNIDCTKMSDMHFQKLKEYACTVTHCKIIENLQYFTDINLFEDRDSLKPAMLRMDRNNPNHVIILMMILLTVYVDQNSQERTPKAQLACDKRSEVLAFFNFPIETINYTIQLQWNGDFLKGGMTITDLPGLGAYAPDRDMGKDKRTLKGHDTIATESIKRTDAMVFLVNPQVDGAGVPALQVMISNAQMREVVNRSDLVIPILNMVDTCRGNAEIDQALDKFLDIMMNTGVDKKKKDIHLYSAIYGEFKFPDLQDDQTCFYHQNYESIREGVLEDYYDSTEAEIHQIIMKKAHARLQAKYKHAGIEELKLFFREAYISKGKNQRSNAAIFTVRKLASELITPIVTLLKNYDVLQGVAGDTIERISLDLKRRIDGPISEALKKIAEVDHGIADMYVQGALKDVPEAYSNAFRDALDEYRKRCIAICKEFECNYKGLSNSARIDQLGSRNRRNYSKLCEEIEKLGINVSTVNEKFQSILRCVTKEIDSMYGGALLVMQELKKDIGKSLEDYVADCRKTIAEDDQVMHSVEALKNALMEYMEQQIDIIVENMSANQSSLAKIGDSTVNQILDLNLNTVNKYTRSIVQEVQKQIFNGWFFSSREYIQVTGTGGALETFQNLSLSTDDRTYIQKEVMAIGISAISNNLESWYQEAENIINMNFTNLREKLGAMMDSTVEEIGNSIEDIEGKKKSLAEKLKKIKQAFAELQETVQKKYAAAQDVNSEALESYRDNILSGIMDIEEISKILEINRGEPAIEKKSN